VSPGGKVNFLGGHNNGHSKQKVSEIELFLCTVPNLLLRKRYYVLFLMSVFIV
jgi:hypothetical protein